MGPRYCATCGAWPAMQTKYGMLCNLCELRAWAKEHPVPLPSDPEMRAYIERLKDQVKANEP